MAKTKKCKTEPAWIGGLTEINFRLFCFFLKNNFEKRHSSPRLLFFYKKYKQKEQELKQ